MGGEAIYIQGHVRYQHRGEQQPVVQHTGIQEGLEDASRAAGRGDDVHLVYEGLCLPLQGLADGGLDALPRLFRGQSFQQMRGIIR